MERLSLTRMCCEVGACVIKPLWGKTRGGKMCGSRTASSHLKLFVPLFLISSITGHGPSGGAARPLSASVPAHQAPSSWSKVRNFGFIPFFTHAKVYLIPGLLVFFGFGPTNASEAGQYISQATTLLCIWSLQNPRRPPSFSLNISSQLRLKWRDC